MENKKGQGVFLSVVAVATLIVAIIGATFAYFSASINSADGAVNLTAYEFNTEISAITKVAPETETGIIPLAQSLLDNGLAGYTGKGACVDKNDKQVCVIYDVTLQNHSTTASGVTFSTAVLKTATNDFTYSNTTGETPVTVTDLKAVYLGEGDTMPTTHGTNAIVAVPAETNGTATLTGATVTVPAATNETTPGVAHLYFAIYLEDTDEDQSEYMSGIYSGQLSLETSDGSHITGTFS